MNNIGKSPRKIVYTALFCALCSAATMIAFPTGLGYVNAGDIMLLFGAFTLPLSSAVLSASIGCAIVDLLGGFAVYAPATLVIKMLMVLSAAGLSRALKRINIPAPIAIALSAIFAELVMVFGYLFYEWVVLGYGIVALTSIIPNLIQGAFGCFGGVMLYYIFRRVNIRDRLRAM